MNSGSELVAAARILAAQFLSEELPVRWRHVQAVALKAEGFAESAGLPADLPAAAWLHDIGYSSKLQSCGFHPIDGARYLRDSGWPAGVCNLVAHHSCAVIEASRRGLAELLATEFRDEPGPVRDALWAADATTGPDGTSLTVDERVSEVVSRYGAGSLVGDCMLTIAPELAAADARNRERVSQGGQSPQPM